MVNCSLECIDDLTNRIENNPKWFPLLSNLSNNFKISFIVENDSIEKHFKIKFKKIEPKVTNNLSYLNVLEHKLMKDLGIKRISEYNNNIKRLYINLEEKIMDYGVLYG